MDPKLLIEGLGKGLRVIESFSDDMPRLTATEAGERAGLTRTAARRYLLSLVHYGYADTDGKHYWLAPSVLRLGQSYLESARIPRLAQPFLQRMSMQTGETANLSVLDGHDVVYLLRSNAPRIVSIGYHTGARIPAHCVSAGLAILSTYGAADLQDWIARHDFGRFTPQTITDTEVFSALVQTARSLGYVVVDQFSNVGLSGVAVPLLDRKGQCRGAISITYQREIYPDDSVHKQLVPALQETAEVLRNII
jgi:IclR family pca regulon transcriptional regulator